MERLSEGKPYSGKYAEEFEEIAKGIEEMTDDEVVFFETYGEYLTEFADQF